MEEQERHTDRFLWSKKIEKHKKKSKLFFRTMPYLSAYLHESLDFFKVWILRQILTFGFAAVAFRAKCKMFSRHLQKPILKTEKGRFKGL